MIPADFGRGHPPAISTLEMVKEKTAMLDAMGDIETATDLLMEVHDNKKNPLDAWYSNMGCDIKELNPNDAQFKMIQVHVTKILDIDHICRITLPTLATHCNRNSMRHTRSRDGKKSLDSSPLLMTM